MKIKYKVIALLSSLTFIVGCSSTITFFPYQEKEVVTDFISAESETAHYRPQSFVRDYADVLKSSRSIVPLPTTGNQKMLVLPVNFPDFNLNTLDGNDGEKAHVALQNAFFGENSATAWRSVTGFYYESSYGQLLLTGEVAPWFTLSGDAFTLSALKSRPERDKLKITQDIVNAALLNYESIFGPQKLSEFDQDGDGIIDSIYVIYSAPYENNAQTNLFWAFEANMSQTSSLISKQANAYAWSSYYYLNLPKNTKPDAHTYIHETGHLLGLNDYYDTNYGSGHSPLGGWDMMDYALGDHSGLSKMLLNWTTPYIPTKGGYFRLRPFTTSGDLLLLAPNWNGSATDEYILLEYYAPVGLNELDSSLNAVFKLPKGYGVKVYHVDARLAFYLNIDRDNPYVYEDENNTAFNGPKKLAHSNSSGGDSGGAPFSDYNLYKLLEPQASTNISSGQGLANIFSLFRKGDTFGYDAFKDFTFNKNEALNMKFKVIETTKQDVLLEVEFN